MKKRIEVKFRSDLLKGPISSWLDHSRWISAWLVASSHLRNIILPDASNASLNPLEKGFYFVTLFATEAVVVFFVLSGLLVGGAVLRALHEDRFHPDKYAIDRASRLYVALLPAVALTLVLQYMHLNVSCKAPDPAGTVAANLLFVQNFSHSLMCNNVSLWSLSSEAYCYLICPFLIVMVARRSRNAAIWSVVLLLPAVLTLEPIRSTPLFGLGLWLCGLIPWFVRVRLHPLIAAPPVLLVLLIGRLHLFPDDMIEEVFLAASFTLLLCSDLQRLRAPLPRLATFLAAFSYSTYLVQMPLSEVAGWYTGRQALQVGHISSYGFYLISFAGIIAVGWMFGTIFERRTPLVRNLVTKAWNSRRGSMPPPTTVPQPSDPGS